MTKELKITISDEVYNELRSQMLTKHICGNICGTEDEFVMLILGKMEKNDTELKVEINKNKR